MKTSKTILVLDDERGFNQLLQELFGTTEHRILASENPEEALQILEKESVDLIVTDYQMPKLTGLDFIQKAREKCPQARFILVSGRLNASSTRLALEEGIGGIFLKPVAMEALLSCAKHLLTRGGQPMTMKEAASLN
jgi:DNA-binding NtrC family response regulator